MPAQLPTHRLRLTLLMILLLPAAAIRASDADWISLFDGKSLGGWQAVENPASWQIEDGALVTRGERSHLFYVGDVAEHRFKNFELLAEVKTEPGSNSGIYVHTKFQESGWPEAGYELQVINSNPAEGSYVENKMTGSIYAIRNTWQSPVEDGEWFEYRVRVSGRTLQTFVNGELVCEYTESANPYRPGDKTGRLLGSGTFALQAHDPGSVVHYRKIQVRLLPDDAASLGTPLEDQELDKLITELSNANVPLIDLGISADNAGQRQRQSAAARQYGVTLGRSVPPAAWIRSASSVVIVNDRHAAPDVELLRAAASAGAKVAFTSGGDAQLDPARLKRRFKALREAQIRWQGIWIPWKD